jgi:Na+-driven multidrug efflux pump
LPRTMEFMRQSLPNIGTLLFQVLASQATVLVGRLGQLSIAASSALSTATGPWSRSLSATCTTISGVRVGYHLGRGDPVAAQHSTHLVLIFITIMNVIIAVVFLTLRKVILDIAANDENVLALGTTLIPAMLVGTYLSLLVSNITGGVFGGMGRPILATLLSFRLKLPLLSGVWLFTLCGWVMAHWWVYIGGKPLRPPLKLLSLPTFSSQRVIGINIRSKHNCAMKRITTTMMRIMIMLRHC